MRITKSQITLFISKEEKDVITNLFNTATDMGLSCSGIGDLVAAIYDGTNFESCRISSVDSIDVNIQYDD